MAPTSKRFKGETDVVPEAAATASVDKMATAQGETNQIA